MNSFDDQLRRALRPVPPPAGFVERTLARAAQQKEAAGARIIRFPRVPRWHRSVAAIAASLAIVLFGLQYHEYREGQQAKEQLMTALEITGSQLTQIQQKVVPISMEIQP